MKHRLFNIHIVVLLFVLIVAHHSCTVTSNNHNVEKIIIDEDDSKFGYYHALVPNSGKIKAVLFLLPGMGQKSEDIFLDSKLPDVADDNDILTIGFSGFMRITADSLISSKINAVFEDVKNRFQIENKHYILGGYSAGGVIALRYVERCLAQKNEFPITPIAVFMVDAPIDLFYLWNSAQRYIQNNHSEISVAEAKYIRKIFKQDYGYTPSELPDIFRDLSPFSIDTVYGKNETVLKDIPVRVYHDVDISWRLKNRNQTVQNSNYLVTSELINRLNLMGNDQAEFIQSYKTGYRRNGERHPHSWSIVDTEECIKWINDLIKN